MNRGGVRTGKRVAGLVGHAALWLGAFLGATCILGGLAAVLFGVRPMVVQSGSMSPDVRTGALVIAVSEPAHEVAVGDVVSVTDQQGTRVTHRVVAVRPSGGGGVGPVSLTLKGDANPAPDGEPYLVTSVDRVIGDVPFLGYVVAWASGPLGVLVLAGVTVALALSVVWGGPGGGTHRRSLSGSGTTPVLAVGAVVLTLAGSWAHPAVRPAGTAAAFSDTPTITAAFATPTVPGPTGAVSCTNGAAFSSQITIGWGAVSGQTARYRYRLEIYATGLSTKLLKSYVLTGTSQVVPHGDLARDPLWSGTANVLVFASVDGTTWRSAGDIRRTIWVGLTGSDYRCQF